MTLQINTFSTSLDQLDSLKNSLWYLTAIWGTKQINHLSYNTVKFKWQYVTTELEVFNDIGATKDDIHDPGIELSATMYGCDTNLNQERAIIFKDRCNDKSRKKKITLEQLPQTVDVVELHSERANLQIQDWHGNFLEPEAFECKMSDDLLEPILMNKVPAIPYPMEVKKCECTKGWTTRICGRFDDGIACTS